MDTPQQQQPLRFNTTPSSLHPNGDTPSVPPVQPEAPAVKTDDNWTTRIDAAKQKISGSADATTPATAPSPAPAEAAPPAKPEAVQPPAEQSAVSAGPVSVSPAKTIERPQTSATSTRYFNPTVGLDCVEGNPPYEPTAEEQARASRVKPDSKDDASTRVAIQIGSDNQLIDAFDYIATEIKRFETMSPEERKNDPDFVNLVTWYENLNNLLSSTIMTDQAKLLMAMVEALQKSGVDLKPLPKELSIQKMENNWTRTSKTPQFLRGQSAVNYANIRYRGVFRVLLHNSGFWVKMVPLRAQDFDSWFNEIDFQRKEFGRILGGHFYLGRGILLKQKLVDLFRTAVIDCNLENWREGTTLIDNISMNDYDTICWAFCTMLHPQGVLMSTVCTNPACQNYDKRQYMDLARMTYINPDAYTPEAMKVMMQLADSPTVTVEQARKYRTEVLKTDRTIPFVGRDKLVLRDPSIGEFLQVGSSLLADLSSKITNGKLSLENDEVARSEVFQLSKMHCLWIRQINTFREDGSLETSLDRLEDIRPIIASVLETEEAIIPAIEQYMTETKISYYGTVSLRCPKCGRQLDLLKNNFCPCDMEYLLFCLSYLVLEQIGKSLETNAQLG